MSKKIKIVIISVVCGVVVLALALGLGLGLGLKPRGDEPCSHDKTVVVTTEPTCTENGSKVTRCEKCGKVLSTETLNALGHDYAEWKMVARPTEQTAGTLQRVCRNDGAHAERKPIPKLDAVNYSVQTTDASCSAVGTRTYTSAEYGAFTAVLPKTKHDYANAKTVTDTSGESPCEMLYCPVCNTKISSTKLNFELSEDGTYYILRGRLSGYNDGNLVIPAYYNDKPVKEIGNDAFNGIWWLKTVTIPETITTFGAGAFNMGECTRNPILEKVYFNAVNCNDFNGKNWVFIPWNGGTTQIELVVGPEVQRIPANMFFPLVTDPSRTTLLGKVTFSEHSSLTEIGNYAFYKTKLTELALPDSLQKIGDYACYGTKLQSVTLNDCLTSLGNSAFAACYDLQSVTFGAGLKNIGNDCFNYCGELINADLSLSQVESVGVDAFKNCEKLQTVKLSGTTTDLGDSAFENCTALTDCQLGSSLVTLGNRVFYGCANLTSIKLPKPLASLGNSVFENCRKLALVQFDAINCNDLAAGNRAFANAGKDASLTVNVGASVRNLPSRLFYSSAESAVNVAMAQLNLDWNLEKVGANAFLGVTIDKAYFNSDASSWNSVTVEDGNDTLNAAVSAYLDEVAK